MSSAVPMWTLQAGMTAVITGAGSGLGWAMAQQAAMRGLRLVLNDLRPEALAQAEATLREQGADVLGVAGDVSQPELWATLAEQCASRFGTPHLLINNAGVAQGGLIWEHSPQDWAWVLGVNLMGAVNGVRAFTPQMLAAARQDPQWRGHIVNVASMAGLANSPNMGLYNVSKHAVVSLSETLYQDLALVTQQVSASVLCPYFVPTGIDQSHRYRPEALQSSQVPTGSQHLAQALSVKAVASGKVSADEVAVQTLAAVEAGQFYIYPHPHTLPLVQARFDEVLNARNPGDPFAARPEAGAQFKAAVLATLGSA